MTVSDSSENEPVVVARDGRIAWVTLNRPDRRNAISRAMRQSLQEVFHTLEDDDGIHVVVLTGAGSAFCAGVDLQEASGGDAHGHALTAKPVAYALERFTKPVIAAINGPAVGGGLELALAADLRVASTDARFALPEVKIGSLPGSGGTQRLSRAVAPAIANKMVFTGEPIDAHEALRCGLISDLVAPDELIPVAEKLARQIGDNAPLSLRAAKIALRAAQSDSLASGLALERALWGALSVSRDREEGRAAFRERRPPRFIGE